MDRNGWLKAISHFRYIYGSLVWKQQVIFFNRHEFQYDAHSFDIMTSNFIHKLILKAGNSKNSQPNYNGPTVALKAVYNRQNNYYREMFSAKKYLPPHINTVLVETFDDYKLDVARLIVIIFKKSLCTSPSPGQLQGS